MRTGYDVNSWEFIEEWYPDYSSSDEIANYLDLDMYLNREITRKEYYNRTGKIETRPKQRLIIELSVIREKLKNKALENFYITMSKEL